MINYFSIQLAYAQVACQTKTAKARKLTIDQLNTGQGVTCYFTSPLFSTMHVQTGQPGLFSNKALHHQNQKVHQQHSKGAAQNSTKAVHPQLHTCVGRHLHEISAF